MEYRVLGRLAVRSGPVAGQLTAPKPRKVLALLLVRANLLVPIETLGLELWGDEPPASAQTIIQTYVLQIRRMLARVSGLDSATVARDILVTAPSGYRLKAGPGELDLHEYERLVGTARSA